MGRSLGIDLVPLKTCSFNCRFCQVGRTHAATVERREYVPTAAVLEEFERWVQRDGRADYATLSGSGEPTLHAGFGEVLNAVRAHGIRSALLTNSSLLHRADVREAAARADVVKASLSGGDEASFAAVNRPHPAITLALVLEGLRAFRAAFRGELWLEVFVLKGFNDSPDAMRRIAGLVSTVTPDRVHLNTVVRPPAEDDARPVEEERLAAFARLFDPPADVIARFAGRDRRSSVVDAARVTALLARRPCTAEDVAGGLGISLQEASDVLDGLVREGRIALRRGTGGVYFHARGEMN